MLLASAFIVSCSENPTEQDGAGYLTIQAFDGPTLDADIREINLDIDSVAVHHATGEGEGDGEWIPFDLPDDAEPVNFLDLINGSVTTLLNEEELESGIYSQLRLVLGENNTIVVNGTGMPLQTPSGQASGVKLNLNFEIAPGELVEIYVDFDAAHSIVNQGNGDYLLKPVFHAFKKTVSGSIAGMVTDENEAPVENSTVWFVVADDSVSTVTDANGIYFRYLPVNTYTVSADHPDYSSLEGDPVEVGVEAEENIEDVNFILVQ